MMVQSLAAEKMAKSSGVMTKHVIESWWPRKTRMSEGAGGWTWAGRAKGHCDGDRKAPLPTRPTPTPITHTILSHHPAQEEN